jgi:carboxypeptidase T
MKSTTLALAFVLFLMPCMLHAQDIYTKVKITAPADKTEFGQMLADLEIDHYTFRKDGGMIATLGQPELERLKNMPYHFEILVPDVVRKLKEVNDKYYESIRNNAQTRVAMEQPGSTIASMFPKPAAFEVKPTFGGYYSYTEMVAAIGALYDTYHTTIVDTFSLGKTYGTNGTNGKDIWCIKISDNAQTDEANEPEVLYLGLQHAREAITGSSMIFFMQFLCENYGNANIKALVDNREIFIVPCFNPDGWEYNRTSQSGNAGGGWRKNRFPTSASTFGVDLNRNWGVDWANCTTPILGNATSCGSGTKSQETYWGSAAFSERETAGIRAFVQSHHVVAGFDQHAYGPYYSLPFGRHSLHTHTQKGADFYNVIPALMGTYNGMRAADSYDALGYEVAGGFKDWMLMGDIGTGTKDTVFALTGEGGAGGGSTDPAVIANGYEDFWAPASEILELSQGMCYQNIQLAYAAGTYVDIQDNSDIALSSTSGSLSFSLKRLGLGNQAVTVKLLAYENVQDVDPAVTISTMPVYYQTTTGTINYTLPSTLATGKRVKFIWQATAGGITVSDTVIKIYSPTTLLNDDMEGTFATNWTNTASGTPASGFGYNYTAGTWAYTASGGYNSTHALSESAAGTNYTASAIKIVQYNSTFDLTGSTSAYLTFMARYRAENFRDKMQVQVSTNGTTWTAISGTTTIKEPVTFDYATINGQPALTGIRDFWTKETFDLSGYSSATALTFRFVFTSDNDPSPTIFKYEKDDGFYIDNVKVVKTNAPLSTLSAKFLDVSAKLQQDKTVKITWDAVVDADHDYFEVERAADGNNFVKLGKGTNVAPYEFTDNNPVQGFNYYRIRQVDKNGAVSYSKTVMVNVGRNRVLSIFPNPVNDRLFIRLETRQSDQLKVELTTVSGKVVYSKNNVVDENTLELKVEMRNMVPQVYILRVTNSKGEVIATEKIVKL